MITLNEFKALEPDMRLEYMKAHKIAAQYRMNHDRIKRLLSFDPITIQGGKRLVSKKFCHMNLITMIGDTYPIGYYINPALVA